MERIEEFTVDGKDFIYFDLSYFTANKQYERVIEASKEIISKYESVYTITNIEGAKYDSVTKGLVADWMAFNKSRVKYGAVIGVDGIKRIIVNAIFSMSGRKNMAYIATKDEAVEWLLTKE